MFRSVSEAQTGALAGFLAAKAVPGTVIVLDGDLGAGKLLFQGFCQPFRCAGYRK